MLHVSLENVCKQVPKHARPLTDARCFLSSPGHVAHLPFERGCEKTISFCAHILFARRDEYSRLGLGRRFFFASGADRSSRKFVVDGNDGSFWRWWALMGGGFEKLLRSAKFSWLMAAWLGVEGNAWMMRYFGLSRGLALLVLVDDLFHLDWWGLKDQSNLEFESFLQLVELNFV